MTTRLNIKHSELNLSIKYYKKPRFSGKKSNTLIIIIIISIIIIIIIIVISLLYTQGKTE